MVKYKKKKSSSGLKPKKGTENNEAYNEQQNSICEYVRKAENDYISGETTISKYVSVSMYETINRIDAYLNSKHISGEVDSQGREKPFFNIVTAAVNIWFRATDLDRKDIRLKAKKASQYLMAFLATVHLQDWMTRSNFGKFLNRWGRTLAKYGSAVVKFVEKDGKLIPNVIPWTRLIVDVVDFYSNPVIEILELTPPQLRRNESYDQDIVESLITAQTERTTLDGQQIDNRNGYIKLYEVHGEFPLSDITGKPGDQKVYRQQMHVISFVATDDRDDNGDPEYKDYCLYKGRETKSPYQKDDLLEEDEQTLSIGAVQNLFDAQWMTNHNVKNIKDQLDLLSKVVYQTSDGNFTGQNALSAIEQGDILVHAPNAPLTQVANNGGTVVSSQNFATMWQNLGSQINGISEAMLGVNPPAGSAWRQTAALLQESHSLFEVMTENKGLALEEMLRNFILPFLKTKMDTADEISATLDSYNLQKIDQLYVPNEAARRYNKKATNAVLNGDLPPTFDKQSEEGAVKQELSQLGNQRFFKPSDIPDKTWKEYFGDMEMDLEINITGEQEDTQAVMETLNTALKFIASATPEQLDDPNFKLVFNKILEATNAISPVEIASLPPRQPQGPLTKVSESMNYKDAPEDIKRQIEKQAGLQPSETTPAGGPPVQAEIPAPVARVNLARRRPISNK